MKRIIALSLCLLMLVPTVLVGCAKTEDPTEAPSADATGTKVKFGLGVYASAPEVLDATDDKNGSGTIDVTFAALTVDKDGKIASAQLDTASNTVAYTVDGKAVANTEFKTKYELGKDYGMVAYGGAKKEWFEQADAFEKLIVGKTLSEVKALVADQNKGTEEVITAGCTVAINEFVGAIEKAFAAATVEVAADATLKLNIATEQSGNDATEEKDGSNKISTYVFAAATDKDGKVIAASSDCVELSFTFDQNGAATLDTTKAVVSKKAQGDSYGMVAYGNSAKEWYEQAAAFDAACIGKTVTEIAGLKGTDGKGTADLQSAGCTIDITGFVKAATKK